MKFNLKYIDLFLILFWLCIVNIESFIPIFTYNCRVNDITIDTSYLSIIYPFSTVKVGFTASDHYSVTCYGCSPYKYHIGETFKCFIPSNNNHYYFAISRNSHEETMVLLNAAYIVSIIILIWMFIRSKEVSGFYEIYRRMCSSKTHYNDIMKLKHVLISKHNQFGLILIKGFQLNENHFKIYQAIQNQLKIIYEYEDKVYKFNLLSNQLCWTYEQFQNEYNNLLQDGLVILLSQNNNLEITKIE